MYGTSLVFIALRLLHRVQKLVYEEECERIERRLGDRRALLWRHLLLGVISCVSSVGVFLVLAHELRYEDAHAQHVAVGDPHAHDLPCLAECGIGRLQNVVKFKASKSKVLWVFHSALGNSIEVLHFEYQNNTLLSNMKFIAHLIFPVKNKVLY